MAEQQQTKSSDPAVDLSDEKQPKGEPLKLTAGEAFAAAKAAKLSTGETADDDDDDAPPALEEGQPEFPDDAPDEKEISAAANELNPRVAKLDLNKKQDAFRLNLGHQETDRILAEIEANCEAVIEAGGVDAWIPVPGLVNFVCQMLGYEDEDELEDAIGGTFLDFISTLPHIETMKNTDEGDRVELRMRRPEGNGNGFVKRMWIRKSEDLWKTLLKAPDAVIQLPSIEFEIGASDKRQIDSVFNHITTAMFNLSTYVSNGGATGEAKEGILECIESLSKMLDIEEPWELILTDTSGKSMFKPDDGINTVLLEPGQR